MKTFFQRAMTFVRGFFNKPAHRDSTPTAPAFHSLPFNVPMPPRRNRKGPRVRLQRATGPGSYDEWKAQLAAERAERRALAVIVDRAWNDPINTVQS